MTRYAVFVAALLFAAFTGASADAQLIPAAAAPIESAAFFSAEYAVALFTFFLVVVTAVLAFATWRLWAATKQLAESTKGLQVSAVEQGKDMKESLGLTRDSLEFAAGELDSANAQRAKYLGDQLFEFDKLLISFPSLQIDLENLRNGGTKLRDMENKESFVKLKSFIYMHLNFFDEIVSTYQGSSVSSIEYQDWCSYIVEKMKHPAYKDVMETEGDIFGDRLRQFVKHHHSNIYGSNGTAWKW
jgi:hypothetical protein